MLPSRVAFLISLTLACVLCFVPNNIEAFAIESDGIENPIPIIGVLTQEVSTLTRNKYPGRNLTSYIASSYIKFVEGAGARAVPVWIGQPKKYYKDIVSKVNGILFPGGATVMKRTKGYSDAGQHIYKAVMELNDQGVYFPIWGICLGFELFNFIEANRTDYRDKCSSNSQALPLEFKHGFRKSRMFGNAPEDVINILKKYDVTANFHKYCLTEEMFAKYGFDKDWDVLSVNHDWNNFEFISSMEHKRYPFYGLQFHPEKNIYEFIPNRNITHSSRAVRASQYFAQFFVSEARKNMNSFADPKEEQDSLIYNFVPEYTAPLESAFVQQYFFDGKNSSIPVPIPERSNLESNDIDSLYE